METLRSVEIILQRLSDCPLNLVKVELETALTLLKGDPALFAVVRHIIETNPQALGTGPKAASLVTSFPNSSYESLDFANTPALRAALGYQVCESLLVQFASNSSRLMKSIEAIGGYYARFQHAGTDLRAHSESIRVFSEIFLRPLVDYLQLAMETQDKILYLLGRYRQRSEWFLDPDKIAEEVRAGGALENRLQRDLLGYIFDNGVDFSVESQAPRGGGRVDVLPVIPDRGHVPIEVKVFDGDSRTERHVSDGVQQAADYARTFNQPNAYYFVYNVAKDTSLRFPGSPLGANSFAVTRDDINVVCLVADLNRTLPSSQASELKLVEINLGR